MNRHDRDLVRLRELRLKREERALEQVTLRQNAVRQAENGVEAAAAAIAAHAANARRREREIMGTLMGRAVRHSEFIRAHLNLEVLTYHQKDLREAEQTARRTLAKRAGELEAARVVYRKHRVETEKLRLLLKERSVKQVWRTTALGESADEDQLMGRQRLQSGG